MQTDENWVPQFCQILKDILKKLKENCLLNMHNSFLNVYRLTCVLFLGVEVMVDIYSLQNLSLCEMLEQMEHINE